MGWPQCNSTAEDMRIDETALFDSHDFTFHELSIAISAVFGVIAIVVSLALMFMHATRYSRPIEQRHIIRILFMVPVYALVSFLSIVFYKHSVYYEVLRDCYEAFAIASFFSLMCAYIAPDLHHQKEYFRKIKPKSWIWPMRWFQKCAGGEHGWLRTPRSGLTWFNIIWVAVFQYCFIRVSMTITAVLTQYFDRYCLESLNPAFAHIWVMVIEGIAVTITMYCIIQFYVQIRGDIAQHKPILKVLAIKLVIFLSFWQTILISFLTSSGAINPNEKIQTPDIKVGIPSMLLCIEMALFAIFHLWSFSYRPYVIGSKAYQDVYGHMKDADQLKYQGGPMGIKAVFDAFNPWDLVKATGRSARWLFRDRKHRMKDASYTTVQDAPKTDGLDAPTPYAGAAGMASTNIPMNRPVAAEEGSGLLSAAQQPSRLNPYATRESDSSSNSPWTEVEADEYFQDRQLRGQDPRRDHFQTAPHQGQRLNPSDMKYYETQNYSRPISRPGPPPPPQSQQQTGIIRLAESDIAGRTPNLPMATRGNTADMHQARGQGQAQAPPYPRSMASVNKQSQGQGKEAAAMPPLPGSNQHQRPDDGADQFI